MKEKYDAIVIGAGPAGLACSAEMAARGLEVALLDEQANPGGQIYRNITKASPKQHAVLGEDYSVGMELIKVFKEAPVEYFPQTRVLILTQFDEEENMLIARQAGALGFIPKKAASAELIAGIRAVSGGRYYPPSFAYIMGS